METPSSTRRVTRSQTLASFSNTKINISEKMQDSNKGYSKSKPKSENQDRCALIDITNDSPIAGLASGNLQTPVSSVAKQSNRWKRTPGSGEALLRGQVKSLLQRVEEEAVISKFSLQFCCPIQNDIKTSLNFPAGILAPTPANTPQVSAFSNEFKSFGSDQLKNSQLVSGTFYGKENEKSAEETDKDVITRSLFLDFLEKSDSSSDCSSVVTVEKSAVTEDDDASIWSIQVNASTRDEDDEEDDVIADDIEEDGEDEEYGEEGEEEEGDMLLLDELCEGMNRISVGGVIMKFEGKHTRFEYNGDDELAEELYDGDCGEVLRLKGLPTSKGKASSLSG